MNKFVELLPRQVERYGDREQLRYRDYVTQQWTSMSWIQFNAAVGEAASALCHAGIGVQDRLCIFAQNCPEILITHFAAFCNRAVPVPIYATSSRDEAAYIVNDSGATLLLAGDQPQYDIALELLDLCPGLRMVVTLNPTIKRRDTDSRVVTWEQFVELGRLHAADTRATVEQRSADGADSDLMYLIYTSGTTGVPKGVMLTHSNFNAAMWAHQQRLPLHPDTDLSLSFLPLSHVFELGFTMVCMTVGIRVAINHDPHEIQRAVKEVQPTIMCSVPRFWEKVYTAIRDNFDAAPTVLRMLVKRAIAVGKTRNIKYARLGKKAPLLVEKQYQYFEKKVFAKLRAAIGIEHGNFFPTAGAMLSDNITEFLHAVGINIMVGYGLTETNASVCFFENEGWTIGTVGYPIPCVNVRIGEKNEILVQGPTIMKGYYNKPEETAAVIDTDGWFHTGDCGEINEQGQLILTERLKDLYKTSNGKYIAPQMLETALGQDKFIDQVAIIGDGRKYVSALIVPDFDELKAYAEKQRIAFASIEDLVNNPDIHRMVEQRIEGYQKDLASYEQIKRFVLLPRPFTMESGELTNTLKIRRAVINKRYAPLIDAMYAADFRRKKNKE